MRPDIIKALKMAALDEDLDAYEIVEEAVQQRLKTRKKTKA